MRIQLVSDLHIEKNIKNDINGLNYIKFYTNLDLLILCGDIGSLYKFNQLISFFKSISIYCKHILYIPGNNEYYTIKNITQLKLYELKRKLFSLQNVINNLTILDNSSVIIDKYIFIGSTLWSNITYNELPRYFRIHGFNKELYNKKNKICITYIKKMIIYSNKNDKIPIILTHYPPIKKCFNSIHNYSEMYYNNLDYLLNNNKLIWCFGHSDFNMDIMINKSRLISNQHGKDNEVTQNYDYQKNIEI